MYLMPLRCTLKIVKMVNFMSCILYHNNFFYRSKSGTGHRDTRLLEVHKATRRKRGEPEPTAHAETEGSLLVAGRTGGKELDIKLGSFLSKVLREQLGSS